MGNCCRTASQIVDPVETRFEHVPVDVPGYDKFQTATIVTGKEGSGPGELHYPRGVAIDEATHQIFVANNNRVYIFSETGEYVYQLGVGHLTILWGITIHGDSIYVSCCETVSRFSLIDMSLVRRIGGLGLSNRRFINSNRLTTDPFGRVFIADTGNHRICILDPDLNHLYNINLGSGTYPYGVKISRDRLYVLCPCDNPCMHVLTLEGDKLHSLITRGEGMDVLEPRFFCLDPLNNFVLSDYKSHSFRIFSPEGNLLRTTGSKAHQLAIISRPRGVAITPNGRLVCAYNNIKYGLQILF